MAVVIDDRLLLDALSGRAPAIVGDELIRGEAFTTSAWYYRLGRAVFSGTGAGSLSGRLGQLDDQIQDQVRSALHELPDYIGLLHSRVVVPVMFALRLHRPVNGLATEALAAATLLEARLLITNEAPRLQAGAAELGVDCLVVT